MPILIPFLLNIFADEEKNRLVLNTAADKLAGGRVQHQLERNIFAGVDAEAYLE